MIQKYKIYQDSMEIEDWLIQVRRDFHKNPELSTKELKTRQRIIEYLIEMGIPYKTFNNHYGVVGIIKGNQPGKTVALRADMDALPMEDLKTVAYRSNSQGVIHGCGHDAHMTILLGTAKVLTNNKDKISGTVKLIFQPAEETVGGAKPMIEDGVLLNPKVDGIFGLHVTTEIPVGTIGVKYNKMNAASDSLRIILSGKSSHGAYPQDGIDAIIIAGHIITALQTIISRNVDPRDSAVLTLGTINGGNQANIIANEVSMLGTIRTLSEDVRSEVIEKVKSIVENTSKALGGHGIVEINSGYPPLINHDKYVDLVRKSGIEILGEEHVVVLEKTSLGVEDFAFFLQKTPGAFYRLGCGNKSKGIVHPVHSGNFDIDEKCLLNGVLVQVMNAVAFLGEE